MKFTISAFIHFLLLIVFTSLSISPPPPVRHPANLRPLCGKYMLRFTLILVHDRGLLFIILTALMIIRTSVRIYSMIMYYPVLKCKGNLIIIRFRQVSVLTPSYIICMYSYYHFMRSYCTDWLLQIIWALNYPAVYWFIRVSGCWWPYVAFVRLLNLCICISN